MLTDQIESLERSSAISLRSAKSTLIHYFRLSIGSDFDSDNFAEIDGVVENLFDAAVAQAKAEILRSTLSASTKH